MKYFESKTGIDLSEPFDIPNNIAYKNKWANEKHNALGYGYDIKGRYAHPASIRGKIIDTEKYDEFNPKELYIFRTTEGGSMGTMSGTSDEIKKRMLQKSGLNPDDLAKYPNVFSDVFNETFKNDTTYVNEKYYYSIGASGFCSFSMLLYPSPNLDLLDYATDEFVSDLASLNPLEIIAKYGTHYIKYAEFGKRYDCIYRATSEYEITKRMIYANAKYSLTSLATWSFPHLRIMGRAKRIFISNISEEKHPEHA